MLSDSGSKFFILSIVLYRVARMARHGALLIKMVSDSLSPNLFLNRYWNFILLEFCSNIYIEE